MFRESIRRGNSFSNLKEYIKLSESSQDKILIKSKQQYLKHRCFSYTCVNSYYQQSLSSFKLLTIAELRSHKAKTKKQRSHKKSKNSDNFSIQLYYYNLAGFQR